MSILVKGMDMPTACRHGECNFACSAAYQTGLICIVRKQYVVPGDVPGDCPCFLVPPHGDLIDRNMLKTKQQEDADLFINASTLVEKSRRDEALNAVANIINAPTIIPAEEDET